MSKLPANIQSELLSLKSIRPDSTWKQAARQNLLNELLVPAPSTQGAAMQYVHIASAYIREVIATLAWQPIGALILIAVVVVGPSVVTVNAAIGSLPGDALYPVKRSLERARISLTFSSTKRAQLELGLVETRLHELQRITKEQAPSPERTQKIALALEELKKDTSSVKTRLEASKTETKTSGQKSDTVNLAKIINEKTSGYQETLQAAVSDLHSDGQTSNSDIGQAISTVQDVAIDALDVLVSTKETGEHALTQEDLKAKVEQQLNVTKASVESLRSRIAALPATTTSTTSDLTKKIDEQIVPTVTYAEALLGLGDFTSALDSLAKTNKQIDAVSADIQALNNPQSPPPAEQTSDEPVVAESGESDPATDAKTESKETTPSTNNQTEQPKTDAKAS